MRVMIHRGANEIGGTCIEIASETHAGRIVLDFGRPLDASEVDIESIVPPVQGIRQGAEDLLAVLISHPHQDHVGLLDYVHESIPIGIGAAAKRILDRTSFWLDKPGLRNRETVEWVSRKTVDIGPFKIAPYLVDHSAYDSYALLIQCDGQKLFYSGDFRGHGRKKNLFSEILKNPPKDIDVLMMEGTVVGREKDHQEFITESELEEEFLHHFRETDRLSLVWTSAQNIDRIVTVYRAAKRANKRLILDAFTAEMLMATENPNVPQPGWEHHIGVYVPKWMQRKIACTSQFQLLEPFEKNRVYLENLAMSRNDIMLFRPGLLNEVSAHLSSAVGQLIYSNWTGYLDDESTIRVREWLEEMRIPLRIAHTSGHASLSDLRRFTSAIAARCVVPIHSFHGDDFKNHFSNITRRLDGEWWSIDNNIKEH